MIAIVHGNWKFATFHEKAANFALEVPVFYMVEQSSRDLLWLGMPISFGHQGELWDNLEQAIALASRAFEYSTQKLLIK